jgi:8-oxo-dGTP pyrophosphatase MutT (NUDIX family)
VIEAAGGVVLRDGPDGPQVLVIHRVRYDDWSLPKGKLDPGESAEAAAVREVEEETGVTASLGLELPSVAYEVRGQPKRVRWFRMEPVAGDPAQRPGDAEVDRAAWWPVEVALGALSYEHDRALLRSVVDGTAG